MARYREKDEADLAWNSIRRQITRELDIQIANAREVALNTLLTKAWDDFTELTARGEKPQIESKYSEMAGEIVRDIVPSHGSILTNADEDDPSLLQ